MKPLVMGNWLDRTSWGNCSPDQLREEHGLTRGIVNGKDEIQLFDEILQKADGVRQKLEKALNLIPDNPIFIETWGGVEDKRIHIWGKKAA